MKLHWDLGIRQATAWFILHRIREPSAKEAAANPPVPPAADDPPTDEVEASTPTASRFAGPFEVDPTPHIGGIEGKRYSRTKQAGRGTVRKTPVVGAKNHFETKDPTSTGGLVCRSLKVSSSTTSDGYPRDLSVTRHGQMRNCQESHDVTGSVPAGTEANRQQGQVATVEGVGNSAGCDRRGSGGLAA